MLSQNEWNSEFSSSSTYKSKIYLSLWIPNFVFPWPRIWPKSIWKSLPSLVSMMLSLCRSCFQKYYISPNSVNLDSHNECRYGIAYTWHVESICCFHVSKIFSDFFFRKISKFDYSFALSLLCSRRYWFRNFVSNDLTAVPTLPPSDWISNIVAQLETQPIRPTLKSNR